MEVQRLEVQHYDQLLNLLNTVFSRKNQRQMDFEKEMPKMCIRDSAHMECHIGIFDGERLVSCMGIYPFEAVVAGQTLRFATTGNVATHWDYEGKGHMSAMLDVAMEELDRLNIDAARLGGLRSRYNRYGFEACGQNYSFTFTEKNRQRRLSDFETDIIFREITSDDSDAIEFAADLYNQNAVAVPRKPENAYLSMRMWLNTPFLALRGETPIGYLAANEAGNALAEFFAIDTTAAAQMICAWQKRVGADLSFYTQPHQVDLTRLFSSVCESSRIYSPSHFKICNWAKVIDAFMKLKGSYCELPSGELFVEISDYGTVRVYVDGGDAGCEKVAHTPDLVLDKLSAARYFFGPYPPVYTGNASLMAQVWFPLPLSWNPQDRV